MRLWRFEVGVTKFHHSKPSFVPTRMCPAVCGCILWDWYVWYGTYLSKDCYVMIKNGGVE